MTDRNLEAGQLGPDLQHAAATFFPDRTNVEPVNQAPHLARVDAGARTFVVRRWEPDATAIRIEMTAKVLAAAQATGETRVPTPVPVPERDGRFAVVFDGRFYSAALWLPGRPVARYGGSRAPDGVTIDVPLPPSAPAEDVILETVGVIGRVHMASRKIGDESGIPAESLAALLVAARITWARQRRIIGNHAGAFPEIRRWLRCGNRVLPVVAERLAAATGPAQDRSVICHGHLWPVHMVINDSGSGRSLMGVVGWNRLSLGSPVRDLAQLAVHSTGWSAAVAENILGAYTEVAPLAPEERRLLPVVAALDLVGEVGRLLKLAFIDDAMIEHPAQPVLRSGLKTMLTSLENLTAVLAPEEGDKRGGSGWRRFPGGRKGASGSRTPAGRRTTPAPRPGSGRSRPVPRRGRSKAG